MENWKRGNQFRPGYTGHIWNSDCRLLAEDKQEQWGGNWIPCEVDFACMPRSPSPVLFSGMLSLRQTTFHQGEQA